MDHLLHCFLWSAWQYVFLFLLLHNFWFSNVTVQFCIPNSNVWKFQLFYILTGSRFKKKIILDFLKGAQWCLIVVLMCISLMTSGVEDCFRSLFPIYIVFVEVYWYLLSIFIGSVIGLLFWECIYSGYRCFLMWHKYFPPVCGKHFHSLPQYVLPVRRF